jgi:hypothetical protein
MHIRTSRVTRNGRTYEYFQLVESFRRPSDGMPSCRIITTFKPEQALEVDNLRSALAAARKGKRVAIAQTPCAREARTPAANLRYLDLAVLLELWREWGLDELLSELIPAGAELLQPAAVIAALSLQRCVDPGSTLAATRWLPRTALVELLQLDDKSFNNTRLHRTLDALDGASSALMSKLARRYEERDGVFASMFLDVSDAWFVGDGPTLAERGKTKEGMVRRKIGIVLLCNQYGYPLRWEVVPGNQNDALAMHRTLRAVAGLSWTRDVPVVFDRAMGKTAHIAAALATGLHFMTALCVTEMDSYAPTLPHAAVADLAPRAHVPQAVEQAAHRVERAGMKKAADDLFVLDLGVVEPPTANAPIEHEPPATTDDATVRAMQLCRQVKQDVDDGRFASYAAAGRALHLSKSLTLKYLQLSALSEQAQRDVLEGRARGCTIAQLLQVAATPDAGARQQAFVALLANNSSRPARPPARRLGAASAAAPSTQRPGATRVRVVVFFNPDRFVEQRVGAQQKLDAVQAFVSKLNAKLSAPTCKETEADVTATVRQMLRGEALLDAFDVRIDKPSAHRSHLTVEVKLDKAEWDRRRRYDGFCVLIAHPNVTQSAEDLCRLFRAKDAVEKDFRIIKSVVELRPIWHYTDAKVRAHVTLCMLALLLERTLERKLDGHASAAAALEDLATCQLNLYAAKSSPPAYTITTATPAQQRILRKLRLQHLADDQELGDRITPRALLGPPSPAS